MTEFASSVRPAEVDEADAVDARVQQRPVDVDQPLERDLMGLHRDLLGLELVRLQAERRVLALESCVAPVLRVGGAVRGRLLGLAAHGPSTSSTSAARPIGLKGLVR